MRLSDGFITHDSQDEQIMVAVADMTTKFSGLVRNNRTAAFIVDCLKEETTQEAIVEKMLEQFDADREVVTRDVAGILEKLRSIGALHE